MLKLKDFSHVLVTYVRRPDTFVAKVTYPKFFRPSAEIEVIKGEKKGVIVAIGPDILGWSLCNTSATSGDVFNRDKGIDIALRRAIHARGLSSLDRIEFYEKVPFSIEEQFKKMKENSEKYFQFYLPF